MIGFIGIGIMGSRMAANLLSHGYELVIFNRTKDKATSLIRKKEMLSQNNYDAEFPLQWMQKDLHMVTIAAFESGVAIPVTSNVKELYRLAMQQGLGEKDFSAIYSFLKQKL